MEVVGRASSLDMTCGERELVLVVGVDESDMADRVELVADQRGLGDQGIADRTRQSIERNHSFLEGSAERPAELSFDIHESGIEAPLLSAISESLRVRRLVRGATAEIDRLDGLSAVLEDVHQSGADSGFVHDDPDGLVLLTQAAADIRGTGQGAEARSPRIMADADPATFGRGRLHHGPSDDLCMEERAALADENHSAVAAIAGDVARYPLLARRSGFTVLGLAQVTVGDQHIVGDIREVADDASRVDGRVDAPLELALTNPFGADARRIVRAARRVVGAAGRPSRWRNGSGWMTNNDFHVARYAVKTL
jgi:hypothetical protein